MSSLEHVLAGVSLLPFHAPFTGQSVSRGGLPPNQRQLLPWGCIAAVGLLWGKGYWLSQGQGCQHTHSPAGKLVPPHPAAQFPKVSVWWP